MQSAVITVQVSGEQIPVMTSIMSLVFRSFPAMEAKGYHLDILDGSAFQLLYTRMEKWITEGTDVPMPLWRKAVDMYVVGVKLGLVVSHVEKIRKFVLGGFQSEQASLSEAYDALTLLLCVVLSS